MASADVPAQGGAEQAGSEPVAAKAGAGAAEISIDDLMAKQKALLQAVERVGSDKKASADQLTRLAQDAQRQAEELQALADRYTAQEQAKSGESKRGRTQVALTPLQRWWIYAQTGIDIEVLSLDDMTGTIASSMPMADPASIGRLALAEAQRRQAMVLAQAEAQKRIHDALAQIESQGSAEVREHLNKLKRDPSFLGGALQKKDS